MTSFHFTKSFSFPSPMDRTPNDPCVLISSRNVKKAIRNVHPSEMPASDDSDPNYGIKTAFEWMAKEHGWNKVTWFGLSALLQIEAILVK